MSINLFSDIKYFFSDIKNLFSDIKKSVILKKNFLFFSKFLLYNNFIVFTRGVLMKIKSKLIISYISIVLFSIILVSFPVFMSQMKQTQKYIEKNSAAQLDLAKDSIDIFFSQPSDVVNSVEPYINSEDFNLAAAEKDFQSLINNNSTIDNLTIDMSEYLQIDNNIFGYVYDGIEINDVTNLDYIFLVSSISNKIFDSEENNVVSKEEKIKINFTNNYYFKSFHRP